jgi:hypothetical protein
MEEHLNWENEVSGDRNWDEQVEPRRAYKI